MKTNAATVERKLRNTVTVQDLIDELSGMDPEAKVLFACDYGDHCHTQQALPVREMFESDGCNGTFMLAESAYSHSGLELVDVSECDDEDEGEAAVEQPRFVIFR